MSEEKRTVRSVFGNEIDVTEVEGVDIRTLLDVSRDLLHVENGDPAFEYGWMDTRDPMTGLKLRKGLWEMVDPEVDSVICPGALKHTSSYRVNELMLVRMPKKQWDRLQQLRVAIALRKEATVEEQYKGTVENISKAISPDSTGEPIVAKTEQVRDIPSWIKE